MLELSTVTSENCLCVVITFNPDEALRNRLSKLVEQFEFVLVVDNSFESQSLLSAAEYTKNLELTLISNAQNLGLGAALNQGFAYAVAHGFKWCVFFDQDTEVYPSFLSSLQLCLNTAPKQPGIIGSNYIDNHASRPRYKTPTLSEPTYQKVKTVITSGSLVSINVYNEIGGFRDDYFIDSIDHEYCLRAQKHNFDVVLDTTVSMVHCLGEKRPRKGILGAIPEHSSMRKYYIARNIIVTIKSYWSYEKIWCLKQITRLVVEISSVVFLESNKKEKLKATFKGLKNGIEGRMDQFS